MSTLVVNVNILPNIFTNVGLTVDAWLASGFLRNPSGQTLPPVAGPAATTSTDDSGSASLADLDSADPYWVRVIDPNGYFHWFYINWEANPLNANFNMPDVYGPPAITGPSD